MTQHYPKPIAPPPELSDEQVGKWLTADDYPWDPSEQAVITITPSRLKNVARKAFQAGADQELEACLDFVQYEADWDTAERLRAARRPKPPSLKEQALEALDHIEFGYATGEFGDTIRRALEALPDD
jgi:hypothetical protein